LNHAYAAVAAKVNENDPRVAGELAALRDEAGMARAYSAIAAKVKEGDPLIAGELAALRNSIGQPARSVEFIDLARAYAALAAKLRGGDSHVAEVLAAWREAIGKQLEFPYGVSAYFAWSDVYAALLALLKDGDPHIALELSALQGAIGRSALAPRPALIKAYATTAARLQEGDSHVADVLTALRDAAGAGVDFTIRRNWGDAYASLAAALKDGTPAAAVELARLRGAMTGENWYRFDSIQWGHAYAAVVAKLQDGDPHVADELTALRDSIAMQAPRGFSRVYEREEGNRRLALADGYAAMVTKLRDGDPRVGYELNAIRAAIGSQTDSATLSALAKAYAAAAKLAHPQAAPTHDVSMLLSRLPFLRSSSAYMAFSGALNEAIRLERSTISWDKAGRVYAAVLLQPASTGEPDVRYAQLQPGSSRGPARQLVGDYEQVLRHHPGVPKSAESWSGDVWAFAKWARDNVKGFDTHHSNVGFLNE
jgi:hypothetical protein